MQQQNMQMHNIVITGGCGFIGVNLVRYLLKLEENIRIRIVDNFSVGQPEDLEKICAIKRFEANQLNGWQDGVSLVEGDILDEDLAEKICHGADGVVHLAANTGVIPSIENPRMDCMINVLGTFTYLNACLMQSVARFVLASSGAPLGEKMPPIHEEMVARPISP
jgi:UDP-glucose 4-epimerase